MRHYGSYGDRVGDPGVPEKLEKCIAKVNDGCSNHQCHHKRGKGPNGLYCGTHANQIAKGRWVSIPEEK